MLPSAMTSAQFRIRFQITCDGSVAYYGWLLDNIKITGTGSGPITWSPTTGLYTDAGATVPYTGTSLTSVYAKPLTTTTYTANVSVSSGCSVSASATYTVNPIPDPVYVTGGITQCGGTVILDATYL